jgi:hypothetical protein
MQRVTVMTSRSVPTSGDYYVSASVLLRVSNGDTVACYINGQHGAHVPATGPTSAETYQSLPLVDVVSLNAGLTISITCAGYNGDALTAFETGTIDAILVGNSNPSSKAARHSSPPLPGAL